MNKTNSKVQLLHVPTGIVIQCQEQRDLSRNRKIAREKLRDELDKLYNGTRSKVMKKVAKMQKRKSKARKSVTSNINYTSVHYKVNIMLLLLGGQRISTWAQRSLRKWLVIK